MGLAHRVAAYPVEVYQAQPMLAAGLMAASAVPLSAIRPYHRIMVVEPARRWYGTIIDRLNVLCSLRKGWDGYDAEPVAFDAAHFALSMLEAICMSDAPAPSIIPGPNGDLQVEWHSDCTDIELHVLAPNVVRAWRSSPSTDADGEEMLLTTDFTVVAGWIKDLVESTGAAQATAA